MNNLIFGLTPGIVQAVQDAVSIRDPRIGGVEKSIDGVREELEKEKLEVRNIKEHSSRDKVLNAIEKDKDGQQARAKNVIIHGMVEV